MKKFICFFLLITISFYLLFAHNSNCKFYTHNSLYIPYKKIANINIYEKVVMYSVGDIMMHDSLIKSGEHKGNYNYDHFFTEVKEIFKDGDIVSGNLETTISGEKYKYTGFPKFNSPYEYLLSLKKIGFNILSTANNHSLDRGEIGVINTIKNLKKTGIKFVGTSNNNNSKKRVLITSYNNIKFAFLSYTFSTNGISIPKGKDYLVNMINKSQINEDLNYAKSNEVDLIVSYLHFGNEYERIPNNYQKEVVKYFLKNGVDIVLGSHPHVVQPFKFYRGNNKNQFVIYSLGNFLSGQYNRYRDLGIILRFEIVKNIVTDEIISINFQYILTYVKRYWDKDRLNYKIIPIHDNLYSKKYLNLNDFLKIKKYRISLKKLLNLHQHNYEW